MAKYVQPIFDVYGVAHFMNQVTFDVSVFLKGTTHISSPDESTASTPYALLVESVGSDVVIQQRQLGDMAWETVADWDASISAIETDIGYLESSIGGLDTLTRTHTTNITNLDSSVSDLDTLTQSLETYDGIQDTSISANWDRWVDSNRTGFLDQTETNLTFTPGSRTFTLVDAGSGWSYYRNGEKFTISGDKTVVIGTAAGRYFITIDTDDGELISSTTPWSLSGSTVLVAYVEYDSTNNPVYWIGEERHSMLIDRRMHQYLHETRGTQFVSGGVLTGPDVVGTVVDITTTDASNALGISATEIADEDIFQTLTALTRPAAPSLNYVVWFDNAGTWEWKLVDTPLPEAGGFIQYNNAGTLTTGQSGKYYNTYLAFTNLNGTSRFIVIPGEGEFDTVDDAIDENVARFDFTGFPIAEYVIAYQLTWLADTGISNDGKVQLASAPVRIEVNATSASTPTTEDHNDLLGLQGGSASERYHLDLAQYNDYIGKSDVDASLATVYTEMGYLDTSIGNLDTLTQTHTTNIATNATDITNLESSVGTLDTLTQTNITNIATNVTDITNLESSVGTLDTLTQNLDASITSIDGLVQTNITDISNLESSVGTLDTRTQNTDSSVYQNALDIASIVAGTVDTWNGLETTVDNSVGLGGTLAKDTVIDTDVFQLGITGSMQISGDLTVDGSITYLNTNELDVSDNIININTGLTGVPPANMVSGMRVHRGSADPYFFFFNEVDDTFRIGINASEGGLPAEAQAVATREDTPIVNGVGFWNDSLNRIDTSAGFTFTPGVGLGLPIATADGTATNALMLVGGLVKSRALGTNAFTSDTYATVTALNTAIDNVDSSLVTYTDGAIATAIENVDSSLVTYVDGIVLDVSTAVDANIIQIAQLDASIIRIDASLNDVIEATDLFYTQGYIDGSLGARDVSIAYLDTNKYDKSGGVLTGLATFASAGFTLDSQNITDIDVSGGLTGLDTHIPTSGAVEQAISEAITAGVTASNGLTEVAGDIQLGGALTADVSIDATGHSLSIPGLTGGTTRTAIISDGGVLKTQQLGTMALATETDYYTTTEVDGLITDVSTQLDTRLDFIDTSISDLDTLTQTHTTNIATNVTNIGYNDTSIIALDGLIQTNITNIATNVTNIGYNDTSIIALDALIQTNATNIATNVTNIGYNDTSIIALDTRTQNTDSSVYQNALDIASLEAATTNVWNGIELTDASAGLGGTLDKVTTITATAVNTFGIAGLVTSTDTTPYALVQETVGGPIKTREFGDMAWATTTNYTLQTAFDASMVAQATRDANQDTSINNLATAQGDYVLKAGDLMTGGLQVGTIGSQADVSVYGGLYVHNAVTIGGDLYVDGSVHITNSETLDVSANMIHLNTGLTGTPPASMQSGLEIGRGDDTPYVFLFDESTETFRIGIAEKVGSEYLDSSTQAVATREDTPLTDGVAYWNATEDRFDTDTDLTYSMAVLTTKGLKISGVTAQSSELTSLMINSSGYVGTRELGSNAFTSTAYAVKADVDASIGVVLQHLVSSLGVVYTDMWHLESSIGALDTLTQTHTTNIATNVTNIGYNDTSIIALDGLIQTLSDNKLDAVATTNGLGEDIYSSEDPTGTALIKTIIGGAGTTVTSDSSTVTVAVTGAAAVVSKFAYNFTPGGTSEVISTHVGIVGTGPYNISVYEGGTDLVHTGITTAANGNITLSWTSGALTGDCSVFITG